jgi:hypothetical protein
MGGKLIGVRRHKGDRGRAPKGILWVRPFSAMPPAASQTEPKRTALRHWRKSPLD